MLDTVFDVVLFGMGATAIGSAIVILAEGVIKDIKAVKRTSEEVAGTREEK